MQFPLGGKQVIGQFVIGLIEFDAKLLAGQVGFADHNARDLEFPEIGKTQGQDNMFVKQQFFIGGNQNTPAADIDQLYSNIAVGFECDEIKYTDFSYHGSDIAPYVSDTFPSVGGIRFIFFVIKPLVDTNGGFIRCCHVLP
jgi:hypothetical protein